MSLLTSVQNKIEAKIFSKLGSTVVRTPYVSATFDKWGDATTTTGATENVVTVPYNYLQDKQSYEIFADLLDGETMMAFKHGQTLNQKDLIAFDGKTFIIKEIEQFPFAEGVVLRVARLAEQL